MKIKTIYYYLGAFLVLLISFLFFNNAYQEMVEEASLIQRHNEVHKHFLNLSRQISRAAILFPELIESNTASQEKNIFFTDEQLVLQPLDSLESMAVDSVNIKIAEEVNRRILKELPWILSSNVTDSILYHQSAAHIQSIKIVDSLLMEGMKRTRMLIDYRTENLHNAFQRMRGGMIFFIFNAVMLLLYSTVNLLNKKNKNEKRFRALFQESNDIIAMLDENMHPIYINSAVTRITGISAEDIHQDLKIAEVHKNDLKRLSAGVEEMKGHPGKAVPIAYRIKHKKGHYIWLEGTLKNLIHDHNVEAIVVNLKDVTERKKSEEEVNKIYKEKETVLNRISDAVVSLDTEWRYTFLNDAAMVTHPLGKKETLGKIIWEVHPGMKGTIFWDKYHEAMQTGKLVEINEFYSPMDTWFSVQVYPSSDGLTIFYRDITVRKKSDLKLAKSLKEVTDYKFALDQANIVSITDENGMIKYVNDNFCSITQFDMNELIGQDLRIINSGYHEPFFWMNLWNTVAQGNVWKGEIKNKSRDGNYYWVKAAIVPFLNELGKPYQYIAIASDITNRKKAEEDLKDLNAELEERVQRRMTQLEDLNRELRQFAFIASHDLQEPLRSIANYVQILEEDYSKLLDDPAREYLYTINKAILRMSTLIRSLHEFSRLGHNTKAACVECKKIIDDVLADLDGLIKSTHAIIEVSDMPQLNVFEIEIRQVFQNLITNAIKFRKKNTAPYIKIYSEKIKKKWRFSVNDNGIGIAPVHFERIFEIFKRLNSNKEYDGSGIGLANCKKIIQLHQGEIWVESDEAHGTTFHFTIPEILYE